MEATPTNHTLPFRAADFSNLAEALDYAAGGRTGSNFYNARGGLSTVLPYAALRDDAQVLARRLMGLELERGSRVALIAETTPDFLRFFFACQYAGLVPVPLPAFVNLGSRDAYVRQLNGLLNKCQASVAMAPTGFVSFIEEAAGGLGLTMVGDPESFATLPQSDAPLQPLQANEVAYLQYTSGSTRFPRGVMITQQAVLSNLAGIILHGVKMGPGDRCCSWLPYYHDMGLVGLVLVPLAAQVSVDYLGTREFAMRPRQWLSLMTRNRATVSFSPPFGYELCARRLRPGEASTFDLSAWRVAGVGAELIRPESLTHFAKMLAPSGFDKNAFLACYGMAECSLAVSFAPLGEGISIDYIDGNRHSDCGEAQPMAETDTSEQKRLNKFVNCGVPLPGYNIVIRDEHGREMPERRSGAIFLSGPSVMLGYFQDKEVTAETLSADGWLNTGDIGYRVGESIVITGRQKDLIIIKGRNIWPQDLEYLAEQQPEVRTGDSLAFSAPDEDGQETTVMVVQCRESNAAKRADLVSRLQKLVRAELAIDCHVELVPLHTLPRTSSGKLSRSAARRNFIESREIQQKEASALEQTPTLQKVAV